MVLGLGCGLMPDLMATSLLTAALCAWLFAWDAPSPRVGLLVLAGLALALAGFTRYTALILAPALLWDAWRRAALRPSLPFWLAFLLPWAAGELWLAGLYGRWHLLEVLTRAGEIPRGDMGERSLGVLARLGLVLGPAALLGLGLRSLLGAALLAGASLALGWPADLSTAHRLLLLGLATLGGLALVGARAREDRRLLVVVGLLVVAGVALGHNYAASRYLLPAVIPLALVLAARRSALAIGGAATAQLALSLALASAETSYVRAADSGALEMTEAGPVGSFTGEWTFRWRMERAGWTFRASPPTEGRVAIPRNAGPGYGPDPEWIFDGAMELRATEGLRLLDLPSGVGFYAETLGPLPLGWSAAPLEEVTLWQVP